MSTALKGQIINKVVLLDVNLITPNPSQPRIVFNQADIESLSNSILANGLLQPLTVRRYSDHFELVSGERRLRALKYANIQLAPCIIVDTSDKQSAVFALLENLQREDLNYFEESSAIKNLIVEWGVSQQEVGTRLGKAQPTIANKLRLLKYDKETQKLLLENNINERQARALLKITDIKLLKVAIEYIVNKQLNVAQTEKYIESIINIDTVEKKKFHPIVKDIRIFLNTINHAIGLMKQSGINAVSEKNENDEYIEYIVRIPIIHTNI
ncbi:MAG: ParB/RepB/Spo0J family partition protein [Oscillospiraceae bacterium]